MRVLSLFSGGGLGDYGLEIAGMEIVGQVEIDEYCQKILKLRWPEVPKWKDVRDVRGKEVLETCGRIDLVSGGFPCQPHSFAGKRKGAKDDRNLWPEMSRVIAEIKPAWVVAENVLGVLGFAESVVLPDLESMAYEVLPPLIFPAHALGAPHRRERVWIVAYGGHDGWSAESWKQQEERSAEFDSGGSRNVADPHNEKQSALPVNDVSRLGLPSPKANDGWWESEPGVGRVAHGVASRVDRLKCLGNGQVVQVVEWIGRRILEADGRWRDSGGEQMNQSKSKQKGGSRDG